MSKRAFVPVGVPDGLEKLARTQPTQNVRAEHPATSPEVARAVETQERVVRMALDVRESLRAELRRLAAERETTIQGIIMEALKTHGLPVIDSDLIDKRTQQKN